MSVRVNLLPEATKARDRASNQRALVAAAGLALMIGLGGLYFAASSQVNAAEDQLLAEEAITSQNQLQVAELVAFRDLADRSEVAEAVLLAAMGGEVSAAGILQDIALVTPADTQLETLNVQILGPTELDPDAVGSINMNGKTLASHTPGVERVLIELDKVVTFSDLYLNSSTLDDASERVASFSLDGRVASEASTGRYANGLPEELR